MQLQLHLHSHNCSWRPCRYFALWPVLQNLLRFHNFWATWLLLQLVGLHRGCWGGRGGAEMSWGRHNLPMVRRFCWKLSTKWRRSLHEQLRQTLGIPFLGRATCLICSLYSGGSHAGAHSCPEIKKGFCRAIASGSSGSCPPGRKSPYKALAVGGLHACVICEGEVVHSCPPGFPLNGSRLKRIEEPEGIEWYSHMCPDVVNSFMWIWIDNLYWAQSLFRFGVHVHESSHLSAVHAAATAGLPAMCTDSLGGSKPLTDATTATLALP